MKPTDHLFRLIKSLSKSEKRYFKLFTRFQKGDKSYMAIVDHLEKMEVYDEQKLKQVLLKKGIDAKNIHVTKNYLSHLILKSLRSYNDKKKSIAIKLTDLLTDASLLEKKGLYDQYAKKLKSAKTLSKKYEKHLVTLEILDREILFILGQKTKALDANLRELQEEVKHIAQLIKIEFEYKEILHRIFAWYRTKNKIRDQAAIAEITALKNMELLEDASSAITFQSKICFFFSHALIYHILGQDLHKANLYYQKVVEIWERYTYMKGENYKLYKIHLSNYLNSCHSIKKYTHFPEVLEKITQLPAFSFDEQAEEFQNVVYLKLLFYMNTLQFKEAVQLIPEIENGIEKYQSKVNKARELSFYCNIALLLSAGIYR